MIASLKNIKKLDNHTRGMIIPLLSIPVFCSFYLQNISTILFLFLLFALIFFALGDYLLLQPIQQSQFVLGFMFFLLSHIFYLLALLSKIGISILPYYINFILLFIYCSFIFIAYKLLKSQKGIKGISIILYAAVLFLFTACCIMPLIGNKLGIPLTESETIIIYILLCGNLIYILSDSLIAKSVFIKDFPKSHSFIMLTYLIAQMHLILGFCG